VRAILQRGCRGLGAERADVGYSMLEATVVVAAVLVLSAVSVLRIQSVWATSQADNACYAVLGSLRQARRSALTEQRKFVVTFTTPGLIVVQRIEPNLQLTEISRATLLSGMEFRAEPGIPTSTHDTPDHFGTGSVAIDFNGGNQIFLHSDGSARDATGRVNNGVVYLARPGDIGSSRAVTLFGATGRIKDWRLSPLAWRWI
jgi:type II secretory pathway pseudopilin PulG